MTVVYEILTLVGIVFWVAVAAYFAIRGMRTLRAVHLKTIESVRKEKAKTSQMVHQPANETTAGKDAPKSNVVSIKIPITVAVPTKARSIWGLERHGFSMGADVVSFDIEKLKVHYPCHEWVEVDGRWVSTPAELHIGQLRIVPVDFIQ